MAASSFYILKNEPHATADDLVEFLKYQGIQAALQGAILGALGKQGMTG